MLYLKYFHRTVRRKTGSMSGPGLYGKAWANICGCNWIEPTTPFIAMWYGPVGQPKCRWFSLGLNPTLYVCNRMRCSFSKEIPKCSWDNLASLELRNNVTHTKTVNTKKITVNVCSLIDCPDFNVTKPALDFH